MKYQRAAAQVVNLYVLVMVGFKGSCCDVFLSDKIFSSLLQNGYRKEVRPRCVEEPAVDVQLDVALRQIIALNEPKQILETNVWLRVNWKDCRLSWNKTQFGVTNLVLPVASVWIPDITLYDNSGDDGLTAAKQYRVTVTNNGEVRHQIPVVMKSLCKIDTTYFPFDKQYCPLTFGMWSYNGLEVNITNLNPEGDLDSYKRHTEWHVDSLRATRNVDYFGGVPYPTVEYLLKVQRKPLFFVLNLFFPSILISLVAILGFLLPPDAGEKVNLEVTVLLSLAVFQLIVLEMMPPNSETLPYISIYFASTMILVGMSCFLTVVVLNIHFKGNQGFAVPPFARSLVVERLGSILFIRKLPRRKPVPNDEVVQLLRIDNRKSSSKTMNSINAAESVVSDSSNVATETNVLLRYFEQINNSLNDITSSITSRDKEKVICEDWELMALVLDRLFLVVYGLCSFIMLLVFTVKFLSQ